VLNLGSGTTAGNLAAAGATFAAAGTGTADSLTINRANTAASAALGTVALTVTGIETININTGTNTTAQTTGTIGWTPTATNAATSLNVSGSAALSVGIITPVGTGLLSISGANMTARPAGTATLTIAVPVTTGGTVSITGSSGEDILRGDVNDRNTIVGGAGNDSIVGGSANDSIDGGDGADTITSGAGNDFIQGGNGDDVILVVGDLTSQDTIDGGAGTNTLSVTAASTLDASFFANITNIQRVALTGNGQVTLAAPLSSSATTFDLSQGGAANAGVNRLTLAAGYTGATTVLETGLSSNSTGAANVDVIINNANVALTVRGNGADMNTVQVTGGTGVDTLVITADSTSVSLANTSGIEAINMVAGGTGGVATAVLSNAIVATGATLTVDASAMTNASATFGFSAGSAQAGSVNVNVATTAVNTIDLTNFAGRNTDRKSDV
jgi:hypothetical protein